MLSCLLEFMIEDYDGLSVGICLGHAVYSTHFQVDILFANRNAQGVEPK
jgi:hypothetical protein